MALSVRDRVVCYACECYPMCFPNPSPTHFLPEKRALCLFLFAALLSTAEAQCKPATLPPAGSSLKCYSGATGGASTSAPTASTSGYPGSDYCLSYTVACTPSDMSPACSGQATGTLIRAFIAVGAATAAGIISPTCAFARRASAQLLPFFLVLCFYFTA
jgi:hypothetical protein